MATSSVRIKKLPGNEDLRGHIFNTKHDAEVWLQQSFINREATEIELVELGEIMPCPKCKGDGHLQSVKKIRDISVSEFLTSRLREDSP